MKNLLKNIGILEIFVDSESFDMLLDEKNITAQKILKYSKVKSFNFIRSPFKTEFKDLLLIPEISLDYDENSDINGIEITEPTHSKQVFGYDKNSILISGKAITKKSSLSDFELESLNLAFIHSSLNYIGNRNSEKTQILVTNNEFLLKNRLLIESQTKLPITFENHSNIVTVKETEEIMDLFLKSQNQYLSSANPPFTTYTLNRGLWYWYSLRSKIPYFHVGSSINEPYLDAFGSRFVYLLRSIDEIGIQYYSGVNNDTLNDTMYHFNYFISLVAGIFDSLALTTKDKYELEFDKDNYPERTSLNPRAGEDFLKALKEENKDLRDYIEKSVNFIKLIYELRNLVIHRKMLEKTRFRGDNWQMNFVKVDKSILNYIPRDDKIQNFKPITKWGIYKLNDDFIFLEPFNFVKVVLKNLIKFSNDYLQLIGFSNFLNELKSENPDDGFIKGIELFMDDSLDVI